MTLGRRLPPAPPADPRPDWQQADRAWIERATRRALSRAGGGWVVLGASADLRDDPWLRRVDGRAFVVFRGGGEVLVAPEACPHLGAPLSEGRVEEGLLVCPWHGRRLGPCAAPGWRPQPAYDDGVLIWARLLVDETPSERPPVGERPARAEPLVGVIRREARCEPEDVLANRFDPWHGAHYHPHSFARLRVLEREPDLLRVRVAYRVLGPLAVEVDCSFHAPSARQIVMTIVGGEGVGSVVETHAVPLGRGRTTIVEATIATSERPGFARARMLAPVLRRFIEARAGRLWDEDVAYAERRFRLRRARRRIVGSDTQADADADVRQLPP